MFACLSALALLIAPFGSTSVQPCPEPRTKEALAVPANQELPLRYAGDGLEIVVATFDEAKLTASGTIVRAGEAPLPFTIQLSIQKDGTQKGRGVVKGERLSRSLRTLENADGSIEVTYRAKRYTVREVKGEGPQATTPKTPDSPRPEASPAGTIRLRKHTFHDKGVRGIASHTMLVPQGWSVEGGAFWLPSVYFKVMPTQDILVKSPEGVSVRVEPNFIARDHIPPPSSGVPRPKEGQSDEGFPIIYMPQDLNGWKQALREKVLPEEHPKAKNIRVKDVVLMEDLTKQLHQGLAQQKATAAQNNQLNHQMGMHEFVDGWVMAFEVAYTEGGKDFEEARFVAVSCSGSDSQLLGRSLTWTQLRALTFTAPKGRLEAEMPLLLTIVGSLRETQPWMENRALLLSKIMKISHEVAMDNIRAAGEQSRIMASAYDEVNQRSMEGYRSRSESSDRGQEAYTQMINETEYYSVPGSQDRVQLPSGYNHVYSNGNDEYILTNDALLDPTVDLQEGNWTAMEPARR